MFVCLPVSVGPCFPSHLKASSNFSCICYIYILSFQFVTNMDTHSYAVHFFMSYVEIKMFRLNDRAVKLKKLNELPSICSMHLFSSAVQKWNLNESSTLLEVALVIKQISNILREKWEKHFRKKRRILWIKDLDFLNVHYPKEMWLFSQD